MGALCHPLVTIQLMLGVVGSYALGVPFLSSKQLLTEPSNNLIVSMAQTPLSMVTGFQEDQFNSQNEQASAVAHRLSSFSAVSQGPILAALSGLGVPAEPYWISNQIFIKRANPAVVQAVMAIPGVKSILEEMIVPLPPLLDLEVGTQPNGTEWHLKKMDVEKVWKRTRGEGVLVAGIDTGVRGTHHALEKNYVGTDNNGWYDPILYSKEPNDLHGHGTHTLGIIAGSNGIGVAPGAKWMACRACLVNGCMQHALLACGQFILCPNDPKEGKKNCTGVPQVVNNSWGTAGGQTWFEDIVKAWLKAGIKPFFANGNSGPKCESASSPGDMDEVVAVGSTDQDDRLSQFSSRGPVIKYNFLTDANGKSGKQAQEQNIIETLLGLGKNKVVTDKIKPNVCAPGQKINSAFMITDSSYKYLSGTSMAAPAVAGVACLLLSKRPNLKFAELKNIIYTTADRQLPSTDAQQCGKVPETKFPNNMYGHGRINAYRAFVRLAKSMKKHGDNDNDWSDERQEDSKKTSKSGSKKGRGRKSSKAT